MQVADLFRPPLGGLSVKCPSRANQASGLAGGFDFIKIRIRGLSRSEGFTVIFPSSDADSLHRRKYHQMDDTLLFHKIPLHGTAHLK